MTTATTEPVGYIGISYFDFAAGEAFYIGGAGFLEASERQKAWSSVRETFDKTNFCVELLNSKGDVLEAKFVDASTCERFLGKPIATLVATGRAKDQMRQMHGTVRPIGVQTDDSERLSCVPESTELPPRRPGWLERLFKLFVN